MNVFAFRKEKEGQEAKEALVFGRRRRRRRKKSRRLFPPSLLLSSLFLVYVGLKSRSEGIFSLRGGRKLGGPG